LYSSADHSGHGRNAAKPASVQYTHPIPRKYLELIQDVIVIALCALLFAAMGVKLVHLYRLLLDGTDFSLVMGDVLFILVLLELFRLLLIYLEEHRVSVATMVEVGIVSTLREVIAKGALHIEWPMLLVLSAFVLTLAMVLRIATRRRYSGAAAPEHHPFEHLQVRRGSTVDA
jgi:uncharacterized membrane protein (DUF373 family)